MVVKPENMRMAKGAVVVAWRNYGNRAFRVNLNGKHAQPLRDAEKLGLAWWPKPDRCALTPSGVQLATEYWPDGGVSA